MPPHRQRSRFWVLPSKSRRTGEAQYATMQPEVAINANGGISAAGRKIRRLTSSCAAYRRRSFSVWRSGGFALKRSCVDCPVKGRRGAVQV
jgi:hypothetical protein